MTWIKFFQPFCPLYRRALCSGTGSKPDACNVDFLQHTRGIATRPNCKQCYIITNSSVPAEWFCLLRDARSVTTMRSFRARSRLVAYLALFALAFQHVVSFGHVHLGLFQLVIVLGLSLLLLLRHGPRVVTLR